MTKDKRYWIIVNNIKANHPDWDQKTVLIRAKYAYQKRYATEKA